MSNHDKKPVRESLPRYGECLDCGKRLKAGMRGPVPERCARHKRIRHQIIDLDRALSAGAADLKPEVARALRADTMRAAAGLNGACNRQRPPADPDRKGLWVRVNGRWRHKGDR